MRIPDLTKEEMNVLIETHSSIRQILITLGKSSNGSGAYKSFKNHCKRLEIELPKFNKRYNRPYGKIEKISFDEILIENSTYQNTTNLKNRLVNEGLLEYKCENCGNKGKWMDEPISLHLDHINGINNDNRLNNLRLLCPNCHSQTKTYGGKRFKKTYHCECGKEKDKYSKLCNTCDKFNKRKVERPSHEELIKEIEEFGYSATGRKYGVSDNAIRKWDKSY
jgi:Zn finger protein HypA/HybF involved in hydrogenase expression